jgi:hypothetical protein
MFSILAEKIQVFHSHGETVQVKDVRHPKTTVLSFTLLDNADTSNIALTTIQYILFILSKKELSLRVIRNTNADP